MMMMMMMTTTRYAVLCSLYHAAPSHYFNVYKMQLLEDCDDVLGVGDELNRSKD